MKKKTFIIALSIIIVVSVVIVAGKFLQKPQKPQKPARTVINPMEAMKNSEQMLIEAAKKSPKDPEKYYNLGTFYLNHNKLDDAIGAFKKSLAISNKYGPALENLGLTYYKKKDYDAALTYLNKALKVIPNTATLHNTIGAVYKAKKMYPEALKAYQKAIELDPKYYSAYFNLALVLQDMKSPGASKAWEKYIELASNNPSEARYVKMAKKNLEGLKH